MCGHYQTPGPDADSCEINQPTSSLVEYEKVVRSGRLSHIAESSCGGVGGTRGVHADVAVVQSKARPAVTPSNLHMA